MLVMEDEGDSIFISERYSGILYLQMTNFFGFIFIVK